MYLHHLSNRVSYIIGGYIVNRKFAVFMAFSFIIPSFSFGFLNHCVYGFMFCILLFKYVSYVFLLLCMLCSVHSVFIVPTGTLWLP